MIMRCGNYTIEKTIGTPNGDGTPHNFYGAWLVGYEKIPCGMSLADCKQACVSHYVREKH